MQINQNDQQTKKILKIRNELKVELIQEAALKMFFFQTINTVKKNWFPYIDGSSPVPVSTVV